MDVFVDVGHGFGFLLAQRARAALRADSLRCSAVIFLAVAFPPFRPNCTAAGFFFLAIFPLTHAQRCATVLPATLPPARDSPRAPNHWLEPAMDGTEILKSVIVHLYGEAQLARTENEHEDFSISLRLLGLLRDGWTPGPGLFDCACGYAVGKPHSKLPAARAARAAHMRQELLRTIPDYDYSKDEIPDQIDGRRQFYGNRFTGRLCDLGTSAVSPDDSSGIGYEDEDYAAAGGSMGDRPKAHNRQSVPGSESATDRPGELFAYRGVAPKRITSDAQRRAWARMWRNFKYRETRGAVAGYFGA